MKRLFLLLTILVAGLAQVHAQTISQAVNATPQLSTLNAALQAAGLDETLDGEGPFTLFAPTNSAFNALPPNLVNALLTDPDGVLTDILLHHVVDDSVLSGDLTDGQQVVTLAGQNVLISIDGTTISVNDATVINGDNQLDNGVVHVINAVLLPETTTIFDVVEASLDHNTLEAALEAAELDGTLSGPGAFTLFAPTDAAFDNLPEGVLDDLLADPAGELTEILLYHTLGSIELSSDLSNGQTIETLDGRNVTVTIDGEGVKIDGALVTTADIVTVNGVVHVIDAVMIPDPGPTLMDRLALTGVHNTLIAALEASNLDETLSEPGTYTLFAPSDAAFNALPENMLNAFLTDPEGVLEDILLQHVVDDVLLSGDLTDGLVLQSLFAQSIEVGVTGATIALNESAQVTLPNFQASNGVMHIIDGILIPETTDIVDVVTASADHGILLAALAESGLIETLSDPGAFTLFAPTNEAFNNLPAGLLDDLLADPDGELTTLLLGHVVDGIALSDDLEDEQKIETLSGDSITVSITGEGVFIDDAQVTIADIVTINGVVHVIDAVLGVEPGLPNIFDIVQESEIHNTLEAALMAAELDATLGGEGEFTLFAPTDEAFDALPENLVNALLTDPDGVLSQVLLHHVVGSVAFSGDLSNDQMIETLAEQNITVTFEGDDVFINGAQVISANIEASNGVVHVIDAVLIPETTTIFDVVEGSENHNTLEAALIAAELDGTLSGPGAFTLFAPTDAAFDNLPEGFLDELLAEPDGALTDILLYHVVDGIALSGDLEDEQVITTLSGETVTVFIEGSTVFINEAEVTVADIPTINGVVHVIDAVLVPAEELSTIFEIVQDSEIHNTLQAALEAAELDGALNGEGSFTLFAPTDEAFDALPDNLVNALLATTGFNVLNDILNYHVVDGAQFSNDLSNGQEITTLVGQDVVVTITPDGVQINNALVTLADVEASNGLVHIIDAVLIPETTTIFDIVSESPEHITLEAALEAASLAETLSQPGAYTLFAPTDAAFDMLPEGLLGELLSDPDGNLANVLLHHVTDEILLSTDLENEQVITSLFGEDLEVTISIDGIFIDDAEVTVTNLVGVNGVVHVIDAVLAPSFLSADDISSVGSFNVFPNPATSTINIAIDVTVNDRVYINVLNAVGQVVQSTDLGSGAGYNETFMDVSGLPAGLYILDVNVGQDRFSHKVQVVR